VSASGRGSCVKLGAFECVEDMPMQICVGVTDTVQESSDGPSNEDNDSNDGAALGKPHSSGKDNTGCPALARPRDLLA
jgi:hypothetical protein